MSKGGSKSGLKTFIFLLVALIGSIVLGIGAFLMLVPESNIFGLSYVANIEKILLSDVNKNNQLVNLNMSEYSKVVLQTKDANIKILCGKANASESNIVIDKNSFGYYKVGSKTDYSYDFYAYGSTLYFILYEPEYSFLKIGNNTNLIFNISDFETLDSNIEFQIETVNGSVYFGGATSANEVQVSPISVKSLYITTNNGNINIHKSVSVLYLLDIKTDHSNININGNLDTLQIKLQSLDGRITANDFTNNLSRLFIITFQSNVKINEIEGDVYLDSLGGFFNAKLIRGDFEATENINTTKIYIDKVEGSVIISNYEGNFGVDIKEILGTANIITSGGNIKIGSLNGETNITTISAGVDVIISSTNTNRLIINTESGNIFVDFKRIFHNHLLTTKSGQISVKFAYSCSFLLNAYSEKGYINKVWLEQKTTGETIYNFRVGTNPMLALELNSESGNIIIDRYNG